MSGLKMLFLDATNSIETPAFVYDEKKMMDTLHAVRTCLCKFDSRVLFPLKCFAVRDALALMVSHVDGFSASSLFEAKLAREILGNNKRVHMTTPGIRPDEIDRILELCDFVSFNSLSQWKRYRGKIAGRAHPGLRVNPELSFVRDDRYNPCRKHSKLGISLKELSQISANGTKWLKNIEGLHFHTNCESGNFNDLCKTIQCIEDSLPDLLKQIDWVNLGGGYLFEAAQNIDKLVDYVVRLKNKYNVEVFVEPGKGIVGSCGYIISSVLDIFESDGRNVAVLDTSVNHMPEVFEYQYVPDILQGAQNGKYKYTLVGATCLAGDLFGQYEFEEPLEIGSQIAFENMGAYTLVKAHMFNGVNLPTIYAYTQEGKFDLKKQFGYDDFKLRCGVTENDAA